MKTLFKIFGKRRKLKGFTLTELIVVTAIMVLLMACVVAFAGPVRMMIGNTTARDDALTINKIIGDYIERKLSFANYVDVYVSYPYSSSDTAIKNSYKALTDRKAITGQNNNPGILLFRVITDPADPLKRSYRLYDIPVTSGTGNPPDLSTLSANNVVFIDEFYNDYEYFITTDDTAVQANSMKKRAYLNFRIDSFDFKGEYTKGFSTNTSPTGTGDVFIDYYAYIDNPSHDPKDNPFIRFTEEKTGSEVVSFTLENIPVETNYVDSDSDGLLDSIEATTPNVSITRGKLSPGGTSKTYSTDTIIFYNIRKYNIKTDTD
jgi:prepilin-type N-terminal cleavage/methylation domain-containing protein